MKFLKWKISESYFQPYIPFCFKSNINNNSLKELTLLYIIQMKMLHLPGSSEWKH